VSLQKIKISIVYDNTSSREDVIADWGFSCVIEVGNRVRLFDTGGNGEILLHNLTKLDIKPEQFTDIVKSSTFFLSLS
jgi:7,8-dihydropterin-6-yl-methyl-4-(beta-D-ribofuranosyl)aminobenzene 5'-phosphate synthase